MPSPTIEFTERRPIHDNSYSAIPATRESDCRFIVPVHPVRAAPCDPTITPRFSSGCKLKEDTISERDHASGAALPIDTTEPETARPCTACPLNSKM